ncbi:hypothetical protein ElyMa_004031300 [Elysia marginata]|uniref:Uncharacterized protein n=1 Tax=Elysia marginata TaxID=1093978 RepID=A0AAV4G589_9GAST|nr:hypothetical protein ElyMa_004031300 [Elysia marginata]
MATVEKPLLATSRASQRRPSRVPRLGGSQAGLKGSQTPQGKGRGARKAPLETPNLGADNLKPLKTIHRPSKTPTGKCQCKTIDVGFSPN